MKTLILLISLLLCANAASALTLTAVNVGKGDALILQSSDGHAALIDCGKAKAFDRVREALEIRGIDHLDAVFLTHTDKDHAGGLTKLAKSDISVGAWYASGCYTGVKEGKHPAVKAASKRDAEVCWLKRGDTVQLGNTLLTVLMPSERFTDKDDNNSLVMMAESPEGRILLTGDMELPEENALLALGDDLSCDILKVPHHGEGDASSDEFLRAVSARAGIISTDPVEKPGTPDPDLLRRLKALGMEVYCTADFPRYITAELTQDGLEILAE